MARPSLNPRQSDAVRYIDGPLLVLAGAGSGKTRVITEKIAYLINRCDRQAKNIAAVTFTNKAAREMKERVSKLIPKQAIDELTVSTFHSLGLNIIREERLAFGLRPGFSILDAEDSRKILRDLLFPDSKPDNTFLDRVQYLISRWKNDLLSPDDAMVDAQSGGEKAIAAVYAKYNDALRTFNGVDFDDLLLLPVTLFNTNPDILSKWQNRYRYLLVDEYQDTNLTQYRLVKQLVGVTGALTVVGDDDQSIYAWRGARPENLMQLEQDFPNLNIIKLEQNYRSAGRILKAANTLIANNPHTFEKELWSELGYGDPIRVIHMGDEEHEAESVAAEIAARRIREGLQWKDFAVLYRGNHQSRLLEITLQQQQIPYHLSGGTSFFARTEIKDILAYLRILVNPDDDNALLRIINTPKRKIGTSTIEKLSEYAANRHQPLLSVVDDIGLESMLSGDPLKRLREFAHWLEQKRRFAIKDPKSAIRELVDDLNYDLWLRQTVGDAKAVERRMTNIDQLLSSLNTAIDNGKDNDGDEQLSSALNQLLLQDLQDDDDVGNQVQLMTLHAAKGLEFPHVYIIGMEEKLLPHRTSIEEDNITEERRLAYVGITRAQRSLAFTVTRTRKFFGEKVIPAPSRFLEELPQDDLTYMGVGYQEEKSNSVGTQSLAGLRAMFAEEDE